MTSSASLPNGIPHSNPYLSPALKPTSAQGPSKAGTDSANLQDPEAKLFYTKKGNGPVEVSIYYTVPGGRPSIAQVEPEKLKEMIARAEQDPYHTAATSQRMTDFSV